MVSFQHPWVFAFGLLGNLVSFLVYLAPLPTFIKVYKKKSTQGYQSLPYVFAIFSCMLWIYYAFLKGNSMLLISINSIGCVIETLYIAVFLTFAPKPVKISTAKLLVLLNLGGFCGIVLMCQYLTQGENRIRVFGWVCVAFSICVFAAPLSIIKLVIRTKSVEYMPFNLSLCLTMCATVWFMYGFLQKDLYITLPNILGFVFGMGQMILYGIYRRQGNAAENQKLPEQVPSPVKLESINEVNVQIDPPNPQPKAQEEEGKNVQEICLHGPPLGPSCNVDAQKPISWPAPLAVQLVGCAV